MGLKGNGIDCDEREWDWLWWKGMGLIVVKVNGIDCGEREWGWLWWKGMWLIVVKGMGLIVVKGMGLIVMKGWKGFVWWFGFVLILVFFLCIVIAYSSWFLFWVLQLLSIRHLHQLFLIISRQTKKNQEE